MLLNERRVPLSLPQDNGTRISFTEILIDDVYGLRRLRDIGTVLDVGAHAGLFSVAVRLRFPDAVIHAYEPNPALWPHLVRQASAGGFEPRQAAVGLHAGMVTVCEPDDSVSTTVARSEDGSIPMTSFAECVSRLGGSVDLLKLDCEGGEWDILQDRDTLRKVEFVTMEYHLTDGHTVDELRALLRDFRITLCKSDGPNYGRVWATRL